MPKINGLETISALRKINANVKALVATGRIDKAELRAALDCGAQGVVAKPFRQEQLVREIGLCWEGSTTRRRTRPARLPGGGEEVVEPTSELSLAESSAASAP